VFVELKRLGGRPSDVSVEQQQWLASVRALGWVGLVAFGWADAVRQLREVGYGV